MFTDRAMLAISEALANRGRKVAGPRQLGPRRACNVCWHRSRSIEGLTAHMVPRLAMLVDRYGLAQCTALVER